MEPLARRPSRRSKRLFDLAAGALILLLALATTYPWIAHPLATAIGGVDPSTGIPDTDMMRCVGFAEWLRFAPSTLGISPFISSPYLMYPVGASHGLSFDGLLLALVVLVLRLALPLPVAWSIALVLAFFLSGLMVYRFAYRRFGRGWIALTLAAAAACMPYIFQRAPLHPNLCYVWVMPLGIHLALNFQRRPTLKRALAWGLSLPLFALSSSYVLIAGLCFTGCAALALLIEWRVWRRPTDDRVLRLMLGGASGLLFAAFVLLPMLLAAPGRLPTNPEDIKVCSVPLAQYLMPHPSSWLGVQPAVERLQASIGTHWEGLAGGPIAALGAALVFLLLFRVPGPRQLIGLALLGSLVLCSGPRLLVFTAHPERPGLPLPLHWLIELSPAFNMIRHPGRMHPMMNYLALAATGYLLHWLRARWQGQAGGLLAWRGAVLGVLVLNMLGSARFGTMFTFSMPRPHPFHEQIAAAPPAPGVALPGAILDIPDSFYYFSHYNLYQLTHRRPLVWAMGGMFHNSVRSESLHFMLGDPQLSFFVAETQASGRSWNDATLESLVQPAFMHKLAAQGVEYVILHRRELEYLIDTSQIQPGAEGYYARLQVAWKPFLVFDDGQLAAYRTSPPAVP